MKQFFGLFYCTIDVLSLSEIQIETAHRAWLIDKLWRELTPQVRGMEKILFEDTF